MSNDKAHLSKAEDVPQFSIGSNPDSVPSYENHGADDLYTEPAVISNYQTGIETHELEDSEIDNSIQITNYGTGLPSLPDEEDEPILGQGSSSVIDNLEPFPPHFPPIAPSSPLSLTLDKALIFPNTVPATTLYSLNFTLNSMGTSITLRRSVPGPFRANGKTGKIIDKEIYDIKRPPMTLLHFVLHGKRKSTYPGVGELQMKQGLRGKYWECKFKSHVVLKGRGGNWVDSEGNLLATEVNEVGLKKMSKKGKEIDDGVRENPGLVFEKKEGVDPLLVDLMVAVWCAKIWGAETYESRSVRPSASKGLYSEAFAKI